MKERSEMLGAYRDRLEDCRLDYGQTRVGRNLDWRLTADFINRYYIGNFGTGASWLWESKPYLSAVDRYSVSGACDKRAFALDAFAGLACALLLTYALALPVTSP